jgi:hypothetical protein
LYIAIDHATLVYPIIPKILEFQSLGVLERMKGARFGMTKKNTVRY